MPIFYVKGLIQQVMTLEVCLCERTVKIICFSFKWPELCRARVRSPVSVILVCTICMFIYNTSKSLPLDHTAHSATTVTLHSSFLICCLQDRHLVSNLRGSRQCQCYANCISPGWHRPTWTAGKWANDAPVQLITCWGSHVKGTCTVDFLLSCFQWSQRKPWCIQGNCSLLAKRITSRKAECLWDTGLWLALVSDSLCFGGDLGRKVGFQSQLWFVCFITLMIYFQIKDERDSSQLNGRGASWKKNGNWHIFIPLGVKNLF